MPTVRNARGADLYAASDDETTVLPIQSKALSKRAPVPLGRSLDTLRSRWWIITTKATSSTPVCYVMTLDEVKAAAHCGASADGGVAYWLQPKSYALPEFEEAWERLGTASESEFPAIVPLS